MGSYNWVMRGGDERSMVEVIRGQEDGWSWVMVEVMRGRGCSV